MHGEHELSLGFVQPRGPGTFVPPGDTLRPLKVALVLSGGGARGDFEVGAVQYLYSKRQYPDIICSTSVGSINAVKLAEGKGPSQAQTALTGLANIWKGLNNNTDMWLENTWFTQLSTRTKDILIESYGGFGEIAVSTVSQFLGLDGPTMVKIIRVVSDLPELQGLLDQAFAAKSLYNLGPIRAKLQDPANLDFTKVSSSGIIVRLAMVSLETGTLRYLTELGEILERNGKDRTLAPLQILDPLCQSVADQIGFLQEQVADAKAEREAIGHKPSGGTATRIVALNKQISQQKQALQTCMEHHPSTKSPAIANMLDGVMASASIPCVFPPVKIGSDNYVDGGVRQVTPVETANQFNPDLIYCVVASASGVPVPAISQFTHKSISSFDNSNAIDIAARVGEDIMPDEILLNEILPPSTGWGDKFTLIQPNFDIHDIFTIDPGLIRIRMAHGYMRADDVFQAKHQDSRNYLDLADKFSETRRTNDIISTRRDIWELEYAANGRNLSDDQPSADGPSSDALDLVRQKKSEVRQMIIDRLSSEDYGEIPQPPFDDPNKWWNDWEKHRWDPLELFAP